MSPPLPPSPPEGPPRGTYFSLRNATQPLPPSPALMEILASSANTGHLIWSRSKKAYARVGSKNKNTRPGNRARIGKRVVVNGRGLCCRRRAIRAADRGFFRREDADELAVRALVFEAHDAGDGGEEAVVFRAADVLAGLVARAALTNQNAAAGYELAAEALDAEPLSVRIASVCGRAAAFFMCHGKPLRNLDVADFDRGVILPVAALDVVLTARLILQSEHLRTAILGDDLADDLGLGNVRARSEFLVVVAHGEHFVKSDLAADFALEPLDADGLAGLDAILLSPSANYGVHAAS